MKIRLLFMMILVLLPQMSRAAVTCSGTSYPIDAVSDPQAQSHTFPALSNGIAFAHVAVRSGGRSVQGTPTIDGNATTRVESRLATASQVGELFYLLAPGSGSLSVSVDWDAAPLSYVLTIVTCEEVNQSSPIADSNLASAASGTTISVTCEGVADGLVVDFASADANSTLTTGANQTNIDQDVADAVLVGGASFESGTGTITMSQTITDDDWSTFCVALAPVASSTTRPRGIVFFP